MLSQLTSLIFEGKYDIANLDILVVSLGIHIHKKGILKLDPGINISVILLLREHLTASQNLRSKTSSVNWSVPRTFKAELLVMSHYGSQQ